MAGPRKELNAPSRLLAAYSETLGTVVSRQRSEAALAAAKLEAELASRTKTEFLANMSHELRTPLNAIIGFAQILRDGIGLDQPSERQRDYAEHIHAAGKHLLGIIAEILDIAKIENGNFELDLDECDVGALLNDCVALVVERFQRKEQRLDVEVHPELPLLVVDQRRVKQIILNVLSNAHKFTPDKGQVYIATRATSAGGVEISLRDTGIGMAPEEIAKALQPFGQVQSAYARNHDGTGLGLPIAKGLMELHSGRFEIHSRRGVGTTVRLVFPPHCVAASPAALPPSAAETHR